MNAIHPAAASAAALLGAATDRTTLRFITCGSVDDGKSTLIGRLLHESSAIFEDQEAALRADSRRWGTNGEEQDYALLVDGLEAEREQGITIDVAYRFFSTPRRAFIVADTPGHAQYTRNMATGASGADVAILLVDARQGVLEQTRRHAAIVALLGIRHVILAINKMDLVEFDQRTFDKAVMQFEDFARALEFSSITAIPLSARQGDNVSSLSERTPWYDGPSLLSVLETIDVSADEPVRPFRFPVQWVNRPDENFRGLAGTIASGHVSVGDDVVIAGSGRHASIARIVTLDGDLASAAEGDAVTLVLADAVDAGRGDMLSAPRHRPDVARSFSAQTVWMSASVAHAGRRVLVKASTQQSEARITAIEYRTNVTTLSRDHADEFGLNDIGLAHIETRIPIAFDSYADNRATGAFILIDPTTNETLGAGMIVAALGTRHLYAHANDVDAHARARLMGHAPLCVWLTGLSGSGKSTIANLVERRLHALGLHTMMLDGDNLRQGLNSDLGFATTQRAENIRRTAHVAKLMVDSGLIVICALVSPLTQAREDAAALFSAGQFAEVFVDAPLALCQQRDPKGLYEKAEALGNVTGIGQAYEAPTAPDLILPTGDLSAVAAADKLVAFILDRVRTGADTSLDASQL